MTLKILHRFAIAAVAAAAAVVTMAALADAAPGRGPSSPSYGQRFIQGAKYLGPAHFGSTGVDVFVTMRDQRGLLQFAQVVNNPRSPMYRRFLTPQQIGNYFGAPAAQYRQVASYFARFGLATETWPQREMIRVLGRQAALEQAFGTHFGVFQRGGLVFMAPVAAPHMAFPLPIDTALMVSSAPNVTRPLFFTQPPQQLAGGFGGGRIQGYSPFDLAAAFDYTGAYNAGFTGHGITIGIIGTGPISPGDVPNFKAYFGVGGSSTVTQVNAVVNAPGNSSGDSTPPPVTGPCSGSLPACNPEDIEAQLDTEQSASLAPDATILFYLAYNANEGGAPPVGGPALGLSIWNDEMQQALADNQADVLSLSFGGCEILNLALGTINSDGTGVGPTQFATAASQGIAVFVSSGDTGPEECQRLTGNSDAVSPSYPATDPDVVSVGGTTTPIGSDGRLTGPITTWGEQTDVTGAGGASGGGISTVFKTPSYQSAIASLCTMRCNPDVSGNADGITGAGVLFNSDPGLGGAMEVPVGGTSASAPDLAAMWALVLQACAASPACATGPFNGHPYRLGNPNPIFYQAIYPSHQKYPATFYDVVYGDNSVATFAAQQAGKSSPRDMGYNAGTGYDLATGLGAPFARALIHSVTGK